MNNEILNFLNTRQIFWKVCVLVFCAQTQTQTQNQAQTHTQTQTQTQTQQQNRIISKNNQKKYNAKEIRFKYFGSHRDLESGVNVFEEFNSNE